MKTNKDYQINNILKTAYNKNKQILFLSTHHKK